MGTGGPGEDLRPMEPWTVRRAAQNHSHFKACKTPRGRDGHKEDAGMDLEDHESDAETELPHILGTMQNSLAVIDGKVDLLSYDGQVEGDYNAISQAQTKMDNTVVELQAKVKDLEAHSRRSIKRVAGIAESMAIDNMERHIEQLPITLLGHKTFSDIFVVDHAHCSLVPRPLTGALHHPVMTKLLNYKDYDAALRRVQELKTVRPEGSNISLYPDFTQHVQEASRLSLPAKCKLQVLNLEFRKYYPAKPRVMVDGKLFLFTDYKQLQQFLKHRKMASEQHHTHTPNSIRACRHC
ncbi:hypothetical protein NDU88_008213 [Pleurodeles waltl]|uniref:Uncharacterized protein n=1 Tax=Pleurodeles waltl TaxID=8319 RepID=A0AAV7VWJ2_PLEWA|nr:hypothetical protein NDU88_008213 [Pleurodeles waltl]